MRISWAIQTVAVFCLAAVPALADSSFAENDLKTLETSGDQLDVYFYKRGSKEEDNFSFDGSASRSFKAGEIEKHKSHDRDHQPSKGHPQQNHGRKKPHPGKPSPSTSCRPRRSSSPHKRKQKPCPKRKPHHPKPKPNKPKPHKPKPPHDKPKPKPKPHKPKPPHDKPKPKPKHKTDQNPKPETKPKPVPENPNPTQPATPSGAPGVGPTAPVIPPTQIGGGGGGGGEVNPSGVVPPGATGTGGAVLPEVSGSSAPQPTSQLVGAPPTTTKMNGSSSSSLATIIGVVVGTVAFAGLVALAVYRRREKRRDQEEQTRPNPEMDEAPRTAFRHESFMALVKDAAQGFYAPGTDGPPRGGQSVRSPSPLGASTAVASAGIGAMAGSGLARQNSGRSQNSQHSLHSRRSGNFTDVNLNAASSPTTLPPLAHVGGRLSD
ncbi:hypothetical protein EC968_007408 [Mortierella alpina]|nr:hypothetical protein EC968_007408 [Mortierella alpina]